jgi:hypothetical protein
MQLMRVSGRARAGPPAAAAEHAARVGDHADRRRQVDFESPDERRLQQASGQHHVGEHCGRLLPVRPHWQTKDQ